MLEQDASEQQASHVAGMAEKVKTDAGKFTKQTPSIWQRAKNNIVKASSFVFAAIISGTKWCLSKLASCMPCSNASEGASDAERKQLIESPPSGDQENNSGSSSSLSGLTGKAPATGSTSVLLGHARGINALATALKDKLSKGADSWHGGLFNSFFKRKSDKNSNVAAAESTSAPALGSAK